jgi:hypothetical protein
MTLFASANTILGKGLLTEARFDLGNPGQYAQKGLLVSTTGVRKGYEGFFNTLDGFWYS